MKVRRLGTALVLLLLAIALVTGASCAKQEATQPTDDKSDAETSKRGEVLVTVEDLAAAPESFFIIDARDPEAYAAGHIPSAISAPWQSFATVAEGKPGDADWGVLSAPETIADTAGTLGIDTSKTIVVYTDPTGWGEDGRVMWTLQSIGITDIKMLDGGYPAWVAAGQETTTDASTVPPTTVSVSGDDLGDINATTDEVKQAVESGSPMIVDARSEKEYDGATDFGEARGGHIKGAVNIPYPTLFNEDGTVKSDADLDTMFEEAGLSKDDAVIVYCTKGIRSAYMVELLRMLGYDEARNYDASYYTWAGDSSLPVEK